mgnify:FL=1
MARSREAPGFSRGVHDGLYQEQNASGVIGGHGMKRFQLRRLEDVSGVSGTGVVAEGVEFSNGRVVLCWLSSVSSITVFDSVGDLMRIHGHQGRTHLVWED